jgi:hypothetical protein
MSTPLTNTLERVDRSVFDRIRKELVAKGYLPDVADTLTFPDDDTGTTAFNNALAAIKASKGFAVEVFGVGSNQKKYKERVPRIVITGRTSLPGAIGSQPDRFYQEVGANDPSAPIDPTTNPLDFYRVLHLPPQSSDIQYEIALVWETAAQRRVLTQIVGIALPKRGYFDWWDQGVNEIEKPFIRQIGYDDRTMADEGFREEKYLYQVEDIFETAANDTGVDIEPIHEITIDQRAINPGVAYPSQPDTDPPDIRTLIS